MARVQWDDLTIRRFEIGVDRGMLYVPQAPGVAWNGLAIVTQSPTGAASKEYYLDGDKYMNLTTLEEYSATIEAFSSPREFAPCIGRLHLSPGLYACDQRRQAFSFSYRTLIGYDLQAFDVGYKIHLIYNVTAMAAEFTHETIGDTAPVKTHSWTINTTPEDIPSAKPASHFVINSLEVDPTALASIEDILYGTDTTNPRFPSVDELMTVVGS